MNKELEDIESILYEALKRIDAGEREAYLKATCGVKTQLRAEIDSLLLAYEDEKGLLKTPSDLLEKPIGTVTEGPGTTIGNYKLLEKIGEGGMAVVYMAEQERPLHRKAALKIIKLGMDTKSVITRFEVERQALAMMEHPNIAKVLDAGATETGRPYFVMELVKGVSITEYCDKNKLTTKERLDLFIQVCNAVQHAHQKGIIHRDIKPSNVMVTLRDGKPVPKVIDFGISKATSQKLTEKTLFTRYAQVIGTPAYMSPEQAEFSEMDIDTRTDIYSLGVLLYELLTGTTPLNEEQLREAGYLEMQRIILEEEPARPSTKLSTLGEALTDVAEHRRTEPSLLTKLVRGDLDWIVMKSLEKDRTRRYDTATEMVADVARHLNYEPVLAGPPSQIYRLRKFIRRHRTQAIGAVMVAVLLAGMAVISAMYIRALNRGEEAEFLKHKEILSKAMEFRSKVQLQDALTKVETIINSKHVGPEARLLRAQLVLELQGPADAVKELEKLLNERGEIAGQAHFLLARIYHDSDPEAPGRTKGYILKWEYHRQEAEKLLPQTADAYLLRAMSAGTVPKTLDLLNKALDLDGRHYDSLRERAYLSYAGKDYYKMAKDAARMIGIQPNNSLGYSLSAVAQRELKQFDEAIEDHNKTIKLSLAEPELYDQRRQTHMRMGNYEEALLDARKCARLNQEEKKYHFHIFCALVALGRYDEAKTEYDTVFKSDSTNKTQFQNWSWEYVFDTLDGGRQWYTSDGKPEGPAFLAMNEADDYYHTLRKKARRVVAQGFMATWSPDGTELVYSHGLVGSSGVAILNLESGKTRLLTVPGKDPAWSLDGKYIAFVRQRQVLPFSHLTVEREVDYRIYEHEEVWIIKADGTEEPRFLARGGGPCWSSDSKRVFYQSRTDMMLCSISIEDGAKPTAILPSPHYFPVVSPDDRYVAYRRGGELQIVDLSTKSLKQSWAGPTGGMYFANWSPNGRRLSVGGGRESLMGAWIYNIEAKKASKILSGPVLRPVWSPDESRLAFVLGLTLSEIWVADTKLLVPGRTLKEHYQEMVRHYTRRIETEPENAGNYLSRAGYYHILDDTDNERADMERYRSILYPSEGMDSHDLWFRDLLIALWRSTPTNLGPTVNSSSEDGGPSISADGMSLFFYSRRPGGYGSLDIYVATRQTRENPWGEPVNLGPTVNSSSADSGPSISADGLSLFFYSWRPGGFGNCDLWMASRPTINDDWGTPVNLGPTVNSSADDFSPNISGDGLSLYFGDYRVFRPGGYGKADIWVTTRRTVSDPWGTPVNPGPTVNSSSTDFWPCISADGLTLYFSSWRPGGFGNCDLWVTSRPTTNDDWGTPVNLGPVVNSSSSDFAPNISADGSTLYLTSTRPGGVGGMDLWQMEIDIVDNLTDKQDLKEP